MNKKKYLKINNSICICNNECIFFLNSNVIYCSIVVVN